MTNAEILALIPEDRRGEVAADLTRLENTVKIESREQAEALTTQNQFVRAVIDSKVSKEVAVHDSRFVAERLPSLVEEEIKKRNPSKDPRDAVVEELKQKLSDMERSAIRERQRSRAIAKLAEHGISDKLAEFYVGDDDASTDSKLQMLIENITPWRDKAIESTLKERFGNSPVPPAGAPPKPVDLKAQLDQALKEGNADLALALQSRLQASIGREKIA